MNKFHFSQLFVSIEILRFIFYISIPFEDLQLSIFFIIYEKRCFLVCCSVTICPIIRRRSRASKKYHRIFCQRTTLLQLQDRVTKSFFGKNSVIFLSECRVTIWKDKSGLHRTFSVSAGLRPDFITDLIFFTTY